MGGPPGAPWYRTWGSLNGRGETTRVSVARKGDSGYYSDNIIDTTGEKVNLGGFCPKSRDRWGPFETV